MEMDSKKLMGDLVEAVNVSVKSHNPKANYIHLSKEYIQKLANEYKVSFDEMVMVIDDCLNPNIVKY
jgi:hypothetical protein